MWLEPRLGTPAPTERPPGGSDTEIGPDAVVGAFLTGGFAPGPYLSFIRTPIVDLRIRARTSLLAETLDLAISAVLIDRRDFMLGGELYCIECEQWRALQRLGSDTQGFEYVAALWFQLYRS